MFGPVALVYTSGFWYVHLTATECDLEFYEVILQYANSILIAFFVAYVTQFLSMRAYLEKQRPEVIAEILMQHLEGIIIWKEG